MKVLKAPRQVCPGGVFRDIKADLPGKPGMGVELYGEELLG